jgi:hypothetical protein
MIICYCKVNISCVPQYCIVFLLLACKGEMYVDLYNVAGSLFRVRYYT